MDKTVTIVIHNVQGENLDQAMLAAVLKRCASRYANENTRIDIYPAAREPENAPAYRGPGSCHWLLRLDEQFTVGAIQRSITSEVEFHS